MKCTIKNIAQELNLSRNTVSKALKGSSEVSQKTTALILKKAQEMGYKGISAPADNKETSSLPDQSNGSILFLTKTYASDSEFWTNVLKGIGSILSAAHYHLMISIMSDSNLKQLKFPSTLSDPSIKGIIIVEICDEIVCEALLKYGLPIVTVDMPKNYSSILEKIDIITMENKKNIYRIVEHLINKGAKRFSFIGDIYSPNVGRGFQERYDALCECLETHHLTLDQKCCLLSETPEDFRNSQFIVQKIQDMASLPDVFICGNDWTAIQMIYALQFLGYKIPKDVSVVGFDNIPASEKIMPSLTTISTPQKYLGVAAARQMLERIQFPDSPHTYMQYETKLILRDSTK